MEEGVDDDKDEANEGVWGGSFLRREFSFLLLSMLSRAAGLGPEFSTLKFGSARSDRTKSKVYICAGPSFCFLFFFCACPDFAPLIDLI